MSELVYLVRHGSYDHGSGSLTDRGREQSAQARDELLSRGVGATAYLLSSDAPRAIETAQIIGEGTGLEVVSSKILRVGSEHWNTVPVLGDLLARVLRDEASQEPDTERRAVAVVHAPLIASLAGHEDMDKVPYGSVHQSWWDAKDPKAEEGVLDFLLESHLGPQ